MLLWALVIWSPPLETLTTSAELWTYGLVFGPSCLVALWIGSHVLADAYARILRQIYEQGALRN